jgi:hypothetical protein
MSVRLSKTYEYRSEYDRQYQARIKAEHLHGSCAECGVALVNSKSGHCKKCKEWEAAAGYQRVVDAFLRYGVLRRVAEEMRMSVGQVGVILTTLRASGHPIPRRRQGGAGWLDPMPTEPIVIARGDYSRGTRAMTERASARAASGRKGVADA